MGLSTNEHHAECSSQEYLLCSVRQAAASLRDLGPDRDTKRANADSHNLVTICGLAHAWQANIYRAHAPPFSDVRHGLLNSFAADKPTQPAANISNAQAPQRRMER